MGNLRGVTDSCRDASSVGGDADNASIYFRDLLQEVKSVAPCVALSHQLQRWQLLPVSSMTPQGHCHCLLICWKDSTLEVRSLLCFGVPKHESHDVADPGSH